MRHCCNFDAYDIWYLKDDKIFTNRTLFIGVCPICKKYVCILSQRKIKTNSFFEVKKVGECAKKFVVDLLKEKIYSTNDLNKMKCSPKPFGWRYGKNKQITDKNGHVSIEQYAVDFNGVSELIKKM